MGDRLGIPGAVDFCFFHQTLYSSNTDRFKSSESYIFVRTVANATLHAPSFQVHTGTALFFHACTPGSLHMSKCIHSIHPESSRSSQHTSACRGAHHGARTGMWAQWLKFSRNGPELRSGAPENLHLQFRGPNETNLYNDDKGPMHP